MRRFAVVTAVALSVSGCSVFTSSEDTSPSFDAAPVKQQTVDVSPQATTEVSVSDNWTSLYPRERTCTSSGENPEPRIRSLPPRRSQLRSTATAGSPPRRSASEHVGVAGSRGQPLRDLDGGIARQRTRMHDAAAPGWLDEVVFLDDKEAPMRVCTGADPADKNIAVVKVRNNRGIGMIVTTLVTPRWAI